MKTFTYIHPEEIEFTGDVLVLDENGQTIAISKRIYDNILKKTIDQIFDFRYFIKYEVSNPEGVPLFSAKKINKRGKLWFEGIDVLSNKKYIISYENWRIGIPTLYISEGQMKIQLEKEWEDWSRFLIEDVEIAKWKAVHSEGHFEMTLKIHDHSPIQNHAFFIAICQATLFVGV